MNKVMLTIFTDPMMGLSYESEPVIRRLETHFGEALEIRYAMCVLVGDVRHFMIPEDMAETPELTLANYNRRLAAIYRKEEEINGISHISTDRRLHITYIARGYHRIVAPTHLAPSAHFAYRDKPSLQTTHS